MLPYSWALSLSTLSLTSINVCTSNTWLNLHLLIVLGWHDEQKPDCKTPIVRTQLLVMGNHTLISISASAFNSPNEARASEKLTNSLLPCYVFARQYHCRQHSRRSEIYECPGTWSYIAPYLGTSCTGIGSSRRGNVSLMKRAYGPDRSVDATYYCCY